MLRTHRAVRGERRSGCIGAKVIHRLKNTWRSPQATTRTPTPTPTDTGVRGYLGCSDFAAALVRKSPAPVQLSPAGEAALFEVFHRRFVHPLLQQRELGGERRQKKRELVRQERKLMAVFKKNDGGE